METNSATDFTARAAAATAAAMAQCISGAMGNGPTTPDYTAWITAQFDAQFATHNRINPRTDRSLTFATAYQLANPNKPGFVNVQFELATTVTIGAPQANTLILYVGSTTGVASGTGTDTRVGDIYRNDLTVTLISLGLTSRGTLKATLDVGEYFALVRTVGTGTSIVSAFDQAIG